MCKIHKAIYELLEHVDSDILICSTGNLRIEGQVHRCEWYTESSECYDSIVTLKDAHVKCENGHSEEYKWILSYLLTILTVRWI